MSTKFCHCIDILALLSRPFLPLLSNPLRAVRHQSYRFPSAPRLYCHSAPHPCCPFQSRLCHSSPLLPIRTTSLLSYPRSAIPIRCCRTYPFLALQIQTTPGLSPRCRSDAASLRLSMLIHSYPVLSHPLLPLHSIPKRSGRYASITASPRRSLPLHSGPFPSRPIRYCPSGRLRSLPIPSAPCRCDPIRYCHSLTLRSHPFGPKRCVADPLQSGPLQPCRYESPRGKSGGFLIFIFLL